MHASTLIANTYTGCIIVYHHHILFLRFSIRCICCSWRKTKQRTCANRCTRSSNGRTSRTRAFASCRARCATFRTRWESRSLRIMFSCIPHQLPLAALRRWTASTTVRRTWRATWTLASCRRKTVASATSTVCAWSSTECRDASPTDRSQRRHR